MIKEKTETKKKAAGKFFAVDKNQWADACSWGIQAAAAYLIMACGTGKDHKSTKWSARSVNKYTGLPFLPARNAIESLVKSTLVKQSKGGARPEYEIRLSAEPKLIWLPNTIITGVRRGKPSPVKQLLMSSNVQALQLFIDLYSFQDLENESGVSASVLWKEYKGEKDFDYAEYSVWNFTQENARTGNAQLASPYLDKKNKKEAWKPFWEALQIIEDLHLIEWVPQLFSGEGGVHMHAYGTGRLDTKELTELMENKIGRAAYLAAAAMRAAFFMRQKETTRSGVLSVLKQAESEILQSGSLCLDYPEIPILRHIKAPVMRAVARLKFRPHTKPTRAWFSKLMESGEHHIATYEQLRKRALQESGLDQPGAESVKNSVSDSYDLTGT